MGYRSTFQRGRVLRRATVFERAAVRLSRAAPQVGRQPLRKSLSRRGLIGPPVHLRHGLSGKPRANIVALVPRETPSGTPRETPHFSRFATIVAETPQVVTQVARALTRVAQQQTAALAAYERAVVVEYFGYCSEELLERARKARAIDAHAGWVRRALFVPSEATR